MCKKKRKWARLGICSLFLGSLALGALLLGAQPAVALDANVCMQTNYSNHNLGQTLGCTANDVRVARATNIDVISGGSCTGTGANRRCTCNQGGNVTFSADYEVELTAQARYDIGIYFSTDGDSNGDGALTGTCKLTTLDNVNSTNFINLDARPGKSFQQGDVCGDIDDAHNPQILHLTLTAACEPDPVSGKLKLPNCTSWRQSGANEVCDQASDAFPGSPSKCNCEPGFTVDIFTETATIEVTKAVDASSSVTENGGTVKYNVTVTNNADQSSVTLDSLTDNLYGNITTTGHDGITATTCQLVTIPAGSIAGNPYTCNFTVSVPGPLDTGQTIDDIVTACGTDSFGHTDLCDTDDASITVSDVSTQPSLSKSVIAAAATVDVTYQVVVTNNSTLDTMTVNSLTDDKFGDITTTHAAGSGVEQVVGTDCSVLVDGNPRTIGPSDTYSCTFTGRFAYNAPHTNKVTGSLTDDDNVSYTPNDTATVTVTITTQ